MTRTEAALAAVRQELDLRRGLTDGTEDLYSLSITVRFEPGTAHVRGTVVAQERVEVSRRAGLQDRSLLSPRT